MEHGYFCGSKSPSRTESEETNNEHNATHSTQNQTLSTHNGRIADIHKNHSLRKRKRALTQTTINRYFLTMSTSKTSSGAAQNASADVPLSSLSDSEVILIWCELNREHSKLERSGHMEEAQDEAAKLEQRMDELEEELDVREINPVWADRRIHDDEELVDDEDDS